ncbi:MAG: hypothetical protein HY611_06375, partial [Elusimicrobia bacterium]|nr:hypothetical protein [Elusimicrobiota bacterium]
MKLSNPNMMPISSPLAHLFTLPFVHSITLPLYHFITLPFAALRHTRKVVSVLAAAALLITAPGLPCYQALAAAGKSRGRAAGRFNISRSARPVSAGRLAGRDQKPPLRVEGMDPVVHASPRIGLSSKVSAQVRSPQTQNLITGYSRRIAGFMRDLSLGSAGVPLSSSKHKLDQITVEVFSLSPKSGGPDAPGAVETGAVEAAPFAQGGERVKFVPMGGHSPLPAAGLRPAVPHQALNTSAFGQLASGFVAGAVGLSLASLIGDAGQTATLLSPVFFSAAELLSAAAGVFGFSAYAAAAVQIGKAIALSGKRQGSGASLKEILFQPVASPNRASPALKMIAWNWVRDVVQAHEKIHRRGYGEVGAYAGQFLGYFNGRFAKIKARLAKPKDAQPAEGLVYDLHMSGFKAGYLAASVWRAGDVLEIPSGRGWFADPRLEFLNGMAYRIAELRKDEAKARAFLSEVEKSRGDIVAVAGQTGALKKSLLRNVEKNHNRRIQLLLEAYLKDAPHETSALRANISDADYTQGYLTGAAWRPGKQVWMPAPSFWERLNPFLRRHMQARYGRFLEGLKASLQETYGKEVRESLESKLAEGPEAAWTQEFDYKLLYSVQEVLEPKHDKALDAKFPFVPGKIKIPASILGLELGHHILIMLGIYMHVAAQPYLVYGLTGNKMMMGVIRNVHFGAYSLASFLPIGPTIDRTDYPTMFSGTSLVRALIMGSIPLFYFSGHLAIGVLMAIVAFNPMFQSLMTNSDAASRDSILGRDENVVRAGAAFSTKVGAISGLAIPFAASYIVSRLVLAAKALGMDEVAGYAMAYAGYAGMLLVAAPIFMIYVRDPRYYDSSVKDKPSKNPLNIFVPLWVVAKTALKAPFYAGAWLARLAGAEPKPVLDIFDHIADSVGKTFSGVDL